MRILVTGGAGFLGSHLTELLLSQAENHELIALDSYWTSTPATLVDLKAQYGDRLTILEHDVIQPYPTDQIGHVDRIYHLACPASPKQFPLHPIRILETSYQGTRHALELARATGARLLFASTSEVYGDAQVCPQPETYWGNVNSFGERSCYDEGKRVAEALCYGYRLEHRVDLRIVRIFNSYGPRLLPGDGRVVSNFLDAAIRGRPLVIHGDGLQSRCFQFGIDCVRGMQLLMESEKDLGPVNLGSERETTVKELAEMVGALVREHTGKEVEVVHVEKPQDDPVRRVPDCSKARRELGWEPVVKLEDGLRQTMEWYVQLMEREEEREVVKG